MERKRIGNDIKLRWAVFNTDGTPVDFTDKNVKVEIRNDWYSKARYPQEVEISGKINELESEIGDLELLQEEYLKTIDEMEL